MGKPHRFKPGSNMYDWCTDGWDPFKPHICPHNCSYCFTRSFHLTKNRDVILDLPFGSLGSGKKYFIGHMSDLFADGVPEDSIRAVLTHLRRFPGNQYVLQSKAPKRIIPWLDMIDQTTIIGTTIETDDDKLIAEYSAAPAVEERSDGLAQIMGLGYNTFLTMEPLMAFDVDRLTALVTQATPGWVNVGADSKGHNLPEPEPYKIVELVRRLRASGITVKQKNNLTRLS